MSTAPRVLLVETHARRTSGSMPRYAELVVRALQPEDGKNAGIEVISIRLGLPWALRRRLSGGFATWFNHLWLLLTGPARVRARSPDVIHVLDGSYAYLLRGVKDTPAITTVHDVIPLLQVAGEVGSASPSRPGRWLIGRSLEGLRNCAALLADSSSTARDVTMRAGVPSDRIQVSPLALDPDFLRAATARTSPRAKSPNADEFILHVGNNAHYKNREGAIRVLSRIRGQRNVRLVLAGPSPTTALSQCVRDLGLDSVVRFAVDPTDAELLDLYRTAAVFLFPSLYEGFGWPPLEAMACGCPVVCSSEGSLAEVAGGGALMCPAADEEGLARLCLSVLEDPELAEAQRRKGRDWIRQYTLERMRNDLLAAYAAVLSRTEAHAAASEPAECLD